MARLLRFTKMDASRERLDEILLTEYWFLAVFADELKTALQRGWSA
jgi:hypothetical protein